jgi:superfamily II DNA/RNA helicase
VTAWPKWHRPTTRKKFQRILVATDCLSEGINLQQLFDTVIHYDLSWNPTRHQQREGRVDRFGQPAELVRSIMMFSPDSAIDGAVLDVVLRKAEEIRKATGVTVPLPDERGPVTDALMASMMLRRGGSPQLALDLRLEDGTGDGNAVARRFREREEIPRALRPECDEAAGSRAGMGKGPHAAGIASRCQVFIERAMSRFGVPLEPAKPFWSPMSTRWRRA